MSDVPEKLLITKAIYQLNGYNKAWLNTNLAKTTNLFTIAKSSRNRASNSEKGRIATIHGNFLPSLAFVVFACEHVAFYTKQDFCAFRVRSFIPSQGGGGGGGGGAVVFKKV